MLCCVDCVQNDSLSKKVDDYVPIIEMLEETKRKAEKSRDEAFDQIEELRAQLDKSDKTKKRYQAEVCLMSSFAHSSTLC